MNSSAREAIKYGLAFALLLLVFFGGSYVLKAVLGTEYPMMVVVSESMVPTLGVGDYIIVAKVPDASQLNVGPAPQGDIIVFLRPGTTDEYIVHRAIKEQGSGSTLTFVTKGDNNLSADGVPVPESNIMGKVIAHVPLIGYFSLFIKTSRGFGLVVVFMALAFLIDYILPGRKPGAGKLPFLSLTPLLVAPAILVSFWFLDGMPKASIVNSAFLLEAIALGVWYLACFLVPISFHDDDSGVMLWLYHLVLVMVPIACDMVWWSYSITPSMWWLTRGSVAPVNWLLVQETSQFNVVFDSVLRALIPGVVIFVVTLYAKRRGIEPFYSLHRRVRGAPPEESPTEPITAPPEPPSLPDMPDTG